MAEIPDVELLDSITPFFENVHTKLDTMRKDRVLTDVVLNCGGKKFEAHRTYLSAASDYLYNMFNSGLRESIEHVVDFPTIDPQSLEVILSILYTGKLVTVKFENLKSLLMGTHMMQLQDIYLHYRKLFLNNLTSNNFMVFWEVGAALEDDVILKAVYGIINEVYKQQEFQSVEISYLRKLLNHLSENETSHDLLLEIVVQWISGSPTERLGNFEEFIELINFQKVSNSVLANILQNPAVMESEIFKNKTLAVTSKRLQFITNILQDSSVLTSIYLLGQLDSSKCFVQTCHLGEWDPNIQLENIDTDSAFLSVEVSEFLLMTKQNKESDTETHFIAFDKKGKFLRSKNFGSIPPDATIVSSQFGDLFLAIAYVDHLEYDFFYRNEDSLCMKSYDLMSKILKLQLVSCNEGLFQITEEETDEGQLSLCIWQYFTDDFKWDLMFRWHFCDKSSNWFSYFLDPYYIVLRSFPGISLYYNIFEKDSLIKPDNNSVSDVVSVDVCGWKVWCLTSNGSLYVQDATEASNDWKLVTKCSSPLQRYLQVVVVNK